MPTRRGEGDSRPYVVMPVIEGQTLRERLQQEGQLSVESAVRLASEVADALDYAHADGRPARYRPDGPGGSFPFRPISLRASRANTWHRSPGAGDPDDDRINADTHPLESHG